MIAFCYWPTLDLELNFVSHIRILHIYSCKNSIFVLGKGRGLFKHVIYFSHVSNRLTDDYFRYDVYLTKEPSVYEAMALVHSRVRRVVFGIKDSGMGGLGGSSRSTGIHCLPGTNHHYRAFRLDVDMKNGEGSELTSLLKELCCIHGQDWLPRSCRVLE